MMVSVGNLDSPAVLRTYFQKRQVVFKLSAVPSIAIQRVGSRGKEVISLLLQAFEDFDCCTYDTGAFYHLRVQKSGVVSLSIDSTPLL